MIPHRLPFSVLSADETEKDSRLGITVFARYLPERGHGGDSLMIRRKSPLEVKDVLSFVASAVNLLIFYQRLLSKWEMQFSDHASLAVIGELLLGGEADTSSFNHEGLFE